MIEKSENGRWMVTCHECSLNYNQGNKSKAKMTKRIRQIGWLSFYKKWYCPGCCIIDNPPDNLKGLYDEKKEVIARISELTHYLGSINKNINFETSQILGDNKETRSKNYD